MDMGTLSEFKSKEVREIIKEIVHTNSIKGGWENKSQNILVDHGVHPSMKKTMALYLMLA